MNRCTMFMDWKTQLCKDFNCHQLMYTFNAMLIEIPTKLFYVYREDYCKIYMESKL